jgi:phosphoketolase
LQLTGYTIAKPTVLARISHEELEHLFRGDGYIPYFVEEHEPERMHQLMAGTLDTVIAEIERIQTGARQKGSAKGRAGLLAPDGRVMEVLSKHQCQGWLEGYLLTGRHGFFSCYEAFIHIVDSMFNQHAKWLKVTRHIP